MTSIPELWQAILVATVLTFLAGFVLHMLLPLHRKDWSKLPDETGTLDRLGQSQLAPGMYMFPAPKDMKAMNDPEFVQRLEKGPNGVMIIRPTGRFVMGPSLAKMAVYHLVISVFVAYVAGRALPAGTDYLRVFQVAGTTAILAYSASMFPFAIWYRVTSNFLFAHVIDGVVWGLLTAGTFGWLWAR